MEEIIEYLITFFIFLIYGLLIPYLVLKILKKNKKIFWKSIALSFPISIIMALICTQIEAFFPKHNINTITFILLSSWKIWVFWYPINILFSIIGLVGLFYSRKESLENDQKLK